jgi:hypothetical protein
MMYGLEAPIDYRYFSPREIRERLYVKFFVLSLR